LITVRGEPKARLVLVAGLNPDVAAWMEELALLRSAKKSAPASNASSALDEVRENRW